MEDYTVARNKGYLQCVGEKQLRFYPLELFIMLTRKELDP